MNFGHIGPIENRVSLQAEAYRELRELIVRQELPPGAKLSEAGLSKLTGYGRAPIRVALRALAADGLVRIVPQSGAFVTPIEAATELRILEVRAELERLLTRCALSRATEEQLKVMQRLSVRLRTEVPVDDLRFGELLRPVHEIMTAAADNEFLTSVMDRIQVLSRRFWHAHRHRWTDTDIAATLHANRLNFIVARDAERATRESDKIVAHVRNYVLDILGEPEDRDDVESA